MLKISLSLYVSTMYACISLACLRTQLDVVLFVLLYVCRDITIAIEYNSSLE